MLPQLALAGLLTALTICDAGATWRIGHDSGGSVGDYIQKYALLRDSGQDVMIDGKCLSACTLVLAFIPKTRLCVTERAILGFHAPWISHANGEQIPSQWGSKTFIALYPNWVRQWLSRSGGLSNDTVFLQGRDLTTMLLACQ